MLHYLIFIGFLLGSCKGLDTHNLIVDASVKAHEIMEKCLHDILISEGWDLQTLQMPQYLREIIVKKLLG